MQFLVALTVVRAYFYFLLDRRLFLFSFFAITCRGNGEGFFHSGITSQSSGKPINLGLMYLL